MGGKKILKKSTCNLGQTSPVYAFVTARCTLWIESFKVFHWQTTINSIAPFSKSILQSCDNSDSNYSVFLIAYEVVGNFQELKHATSLEN